MTTKMTKKAQAEQDRQQAIEMLRKIFPKGATVNTIVRHVSRSGMQRAISVLDVDSETGRVYEISGLVARALELHLHPTERGVKMNGCGMDMAWEIVYRLGHALYGDELGYHDSGYILHHNSV